MIMGKLCLSFTDIFRAHTVRTFILIASIFLNFNIHFTGSTTNAFSLHGVNSCTENVKSCLNRSVRLSVHVFVGFFCEILKGISVKFA